MTTKTITRLMSTNSKDGKVIITFARVIDHGKCGHHYSINLSKLCVKSQTRLDNLTYQAQKTTVMYFHDFIFVTTVFRDRVIIK